MHEVHPAEGSFDSTLLTLAEWSPHFRRQGEAVAYYFEGNGFHERCRIQLFDSISSLFSFLHSW